MTGSAGPPTVAAVSPAGNAGCLFPALMSTLPVLVPAGSSVRMVPARPSIRMGPAGPSVRMVPAGPSFPRFPAGLYFLGVASDLGQLFRPCVVPFGVAFLRVVFFRVVLFGVELRFNGFAGLALPGGFVPGLPYPRRWSLAPRI